MERLSKCLPLTCSKTFRTFVLMMGFMVSSGTNDELYKRFPMPQRNGSFWSPNFPSPYPPNIRYEWVFPYSEDVVRVHFDEMDLYRCYTRDDNQDCLMYDHVLVQHLWPAYCNWYKPSGPLSFGPRVQTTITFRSRPNTKEACRGKGFKATFKRYPQIHSVTPSAITTTMTTLKRGSKEVNNEDMKVIIIIGIIIIVLSVVAVIVCCCYRRVKNRRNRRRQRSESQSRERTSPYSAIPQRGAQTESIELTRHPLPEPSFTRARGPPPTYDTVSNIDSIGEFESPPSYESVLRGDLATNSRQSSQRSHRSRDVTHPQRTRPDGHNRRDVREEPTNSERTMIPANTRQSRDSQSRRVPHSRNQLHEVDEQGIANQESAIDTSLSRDATRVPRTHGNQNQDVDSESTNERGSRAGEPQTTDHPLFRDTNGNRENQRHQRMSNSTITAGVSQGDSQENEIAESSRSRRASDRQVFV